MVHTAVAPSGNSTVLDIPAVNGRADAIIIATPVSATVNGAARNTGVFYTAGSGRWSIYNEDLAPMLAGSQFNVRAMAPSATALVHKVSAASVSGHITYLDIPSINGDPFASIQVRHVWNAPGTTATYNNHPIGVWYNTSSAKWAIYNEDLVAMPVTAAFNIKLGSRAVVTASAANLVSGALVVDLPDFNGQPNAKLFATHVYNTSGGAGTYYTRAVSVRYDLPTSKWRIVNLDGTAVPTGAAFNVHRGY